MDAGLSALLLGLALYVAVEKIPADWWRAAGGALIILTVLAIAWQLASLS